MIAALAKDRAYRERASYNWAMLCALGLAVAALLSPADLPQIQKRSKTGEPQNLKNEPMPADTWKGRRYAGGGVTVTYYVYWVYVSEYDYGFDSTCILHCKGGKHLSHQTCDVTCDSICRSKHDITIKPKFEFLNNADGRGNTWEIGVRKGIGTGGGRTSQGTQLASQLRDLAMKPIKDNIDKYTYKYKSGHWNNTPCSVHDRKFKYSTYSLFASYSVYKDGKSIGGSSNLSLGLGHPLLGTVKIPHKKFYEQKPVENCKCQFVRQKQRNIRIGGFVPLEGEGGESGSGLRFGGLYIDPDSDGKYAQYNESHTGDVMIEYRLENLNNFTVIATNMTAMPLGLALMPGTTFAPEDNDFQSMVNLDMVQWFVGPNSTREFVVPLAGPSQDPVTVGGFMACLNMGKKQPDGSAPYILGSTLDSRLIDMGYDISQQRFRGPWTQAQLWIYMDGATPKEINDRLFPPVSETRYLNGLYEIANTYHADLTDRKYNDVWTPKLMLADGATPEQLGWFVDEMAERDARKLANWVKGNAGEFSYLFAPDAQDWYMGHAVNVANALCGSGHIEVQAAGLNFLSRFVPQAKRAELMEKGGLVGAVSLALGGGKNAGSAMMVVEQYDAELAEQLKTEPDELPFPDIDPPTRER